MFINRFEQAEERITEFEYRSIEIIQAEKQKDKTMTKNEQSLVDQGTPSRIQIYA